MFHYLRLMEEISNLNNALNAYIELCGLVDKVLISEAGCATRKVAIATIQNKLQELELEQG